MATRGRTLQWTLAGDPIPLERALAQAERRVGAFARANEEANRRAMASNASLAQRFTHDHALMAGALGRTQRTVREFGSHTVTALKGAGLAFAGAAYEAGKWGIEFQQSMEMIHTQAGASQAEVKKLHNAVLALAETVPQGPQELAKGLFHLESIGLRGAKAMNTLKVAAEGAAVGNAKLEDTATALGSAFLVGIKGAGNLRHVMGLLNATVGAGNMRMEELVQALGTGILPASKTAGLSIRDVMGAMAVFTDEGYQASAAAAQFSTALHFLYNPSSKASTALKSIGLSATTMAADMHKPNGLLKALTDLHDHLEKLPGGARGVQAEQVLGDILPGGRGRIMLTLLNQLDRYQMKLGQIEKTTGSFNDAVTRTQQTDAYKIKTAWSGIQATVIRFWDKAQPSFARGLSMASRDLQRFSVDLSADQGFKTGSDYMGAIGRAFRESGMQRDIKSLHIPQHFENVLEAAVPIVAKDAGKLGLTVAEEFTKAFVTGGPMTKLALGSFFITKFVGWRNLFSHLGATSGTAFATGFGKSAAVGEAAALGLGGVGGTASKISQEAGPLRGGQLIYGSQFRYGAPVSQLGERGAVAYLKRLPGAARAALLGLPFGTAAALAAVTGYGITKGMDALQPTGGPFDLPQPQSHFERLMSSYIPGVDPSHGITGGFGIAADVQRAGKYTKQLQELMARRDTLGLVKGAKELQVALYEAKRNGADPSLVQHLTEARDAFRSAAREADKMGVATLKAFPSHSRFHSEAGIFREIESQFAHMSNSGREAGARAMIEMSQQMEEKGRLPKGATAKLIRDIESKYPSLILTMKEAGLDSTKALATALKDQRVVKAVRSQINTIGKTWDDAPKLAQTNAHNARENWQREMDFLHDKIAHSTGQQRDVAVSQWREMARLGKATSKELSHQLARDAATTAARTSGSYKNLAGNVISATGTIAQATNKILGQLGETHKLTWQTSFKSSSFRRRGGRNFGEGGVVPIWAAGGEMLVDGDRAAIIPGNPKRDATPLLAPVGSTVLTWDGQARMMMGESLESARANQAPHFARGGRVASIAAMTAEANAIDRQHYAYSWGGGHNPSFSGPYDCSGAVSAVLHAAGVLNRPMVAADFMHWGLPGKGPATIYASPSHVYMSILGRFFGTSNSNPGGGAGWFPGGPRPGFVERHVPADSEFIRRLLWQGPGGALRQLGQRTSDRDVKAANRRLQHVMASRGQFGGGDWGNVGGSAQKAIFNFFQHAGMSKIGIAGLIGNAVQESSLNWSAPGGGMWQQISNFGSGAPSPLTQMQTMLGQIRASGVFAAMNRASTPEQAAEIFERGFERAGIPAMSNRTAAARAAFNAGFRGGGRVPRFVPLWGRVPQGLQAGGLVGGSGSFHRGWPRPMWDPFTKKWESMSRARYIAIEKKWYRQHPAQTIPTGPPRTRHFDPFAGRMRDLTPGSWHAIIDRWHRHHPTEPIPTHAYHEAPVQTAQKSWDHIFAQSDADIALAALTPDTSDDAAALQRRISEDVKALDYARRHRDLQRITQYANQLASDRDTLKGLTGGDTAQNIVQAIRDLKASIDAQTKVYKATGMVERNEGLRLVGDMLSGELGGRVAQRSPTPGDGAVARY